MSTGYNDIKRATDDIGRAFALLAIVFVVGFLLLPIICAIAMSFDNRTFLGRFPPTGFSLQWYRSFFSDDYYTRGLRTSLLLGMQAAILATAIGVPAALCLHRYRFPGSTALMSLFMSPLMIPQVVIGFSLLFLFNKLGMNTGYTRLLIGHVVITIPYTIRASLAGLAGVNDRLIQAAMSLGASERRAFWDVTFPLARTGMMVGTIFAFAFSLDDVAVTLFLADPENYTLPIAILTNMRANFDLTLAAAATLLIILTVVVGLVLDRLVGIEKILGQGIYH